MVESTNDRNYNRWLKVKLIDIFLPKKFFLDRFLGRLLGRERVFFFYFFFFKFHIFFYKFPRQLFNFCLYKIYKWSTKILNMCNRKMSNIEVGFNGANVTSSYGTNFEGLPQIMNYFVHCFIISRVD